MAQISKNDTVFDLYCGIGTISLFMAKYAKKVYGIEIVEEAIEAAEDVVAEETTEESSKDVEEEEAESPFIPARIPSKIEQEVQESKVDTASMELTIIALIFFIFILFTY